MKNVLFATTALVAFAGAAAAEVSFSGDMTAGYNDQIEGGLFWEADLDAKFTVDMGDGITVIASVNLFNWEGDNNDPHNPLDYIEVSYAGDAYSASLKFGDLADKGASEYFYADRSGMAVDVENHDDDDDVRALVEFGNYGFAAGCENVDGSNCDNGSNFGLGATFGSFELGVGYDDGAGGQAQVTAVSVDTTFGAAEIGVSYASSAAENSIGVALSYALNGMITVGGYYANNSASDDAWGVDVAYTSGPLSVGVYYDDTTTGASEYGADVGYAITDQITANVGLFSDGTFVYYAGIDYAVNDSVTATVSYATADEIGGPEYKDGITALITASF